jgi:hypothetical protein
MPTLWFAIVQAFFYLVAEHSVAFGWSPGVGGIPRRAD